MAAFSFRATSKAKKSVEKVRAQEWAEPLGQALAVSAAIAEAFEAFPGAKIISGALSFGATLLNPESSGEDQTGKVEQIKQEVKSSNKEVPEEMSRVKELLTQTFHIVVDSRFKVNMSCINT